MSITVIPVSDDYLLHVSVVPVPSVGGHHLRIESQWLAARDPQACQLQYSVTLPANQLAEIAGVINEGTS